MARFIKFEGSRVPGTWYHTGDFVVSTIDTFEPDRTVFDRTARSVIQDDCHASGVLGAGYKHYIENAELCTKEGIDEEALKKAAKDRIVWICEFIGTTITSDDKDFTDKARVAIASIWTNAFDRI